MIVTVLFEVIQGRGRFREIFSLYIHISIYSKIILPTKKLVKPVRTLLNLSLQQSLQTCLTSPPVIDFL